MHYRPTARPTAVDLFCGVGGLSLGLVQAGFRLLAGFDADRTTLCVYEKNFPGVLARPFDLISCTGTQLRRVLKLKGAPIDLLAGGPPCQGFSAGGLQAERDPRNRGVLAFARLVNELRPRYFLMENVRGFTFKEHASLRKQFLRMLARGGYKVRPFELLNAADFGVPQRRLRVFALGCLESERLPEYPTAIFDCRVTVRDAIADLMVVDKHAEGRDGDIFAGKLEEPLPYAAGLRAHPSGAVVSRLTGCLRTTHSDEVVERFKATLPGDQEPVSRFYRLSWEGVSPTLRAGTGPEHGSHTAPRPIHPEWPRCVTVREAARLHSFPDWFVFHNTRWHGFRQIGNSVPPLLAKAVGEAVRNVASHR
jgi:DNA (cytosine-5)-methyltransferase 1